MVRVVPIPEPAPVYARDDVDVPEDAGSVMYPAGVTAATTATGLTVLVRVVPGLDTSLVVTPPEVASTDAKVVVVSSVGLVSVAVVSVVVLSVVVSDVVLSVVLLDVVVSVVVLSVVVSDVVLSVVVSDVVVSVVVLSVVVLFVVSQVSVVFVGGVGFGYVGLVGSVACGIRRLGGRRPLMSTAVRRPVLTTGQGDAPESE